MNAESLKEAIKRELPRLLREDAAFRAYVLELTSGAYAPRGETQDRFNQLLEELRRDREEQARKWDDCKRKGRDREEQARKWDDLQAELGRDREEQARKWDDLQAELGRDREEQARKWDDQQAELRRDREEQARKWDESRQEFNRVHEEIMAQAKKYDRGIGALGARWGIQSEAAFRNALAGILEQNFGVQVINVNEFDDQGVVFGRPEQVEIDIIIKNGLLLICEMKSSIDKAGMYIFERKARFYEERHERKAQRLIVISPMIDPKARQVADKLGIQTYSDSEDVESLLTDSVGKEKKMWPVRFLTIRRKLQVLANVFNP